MPQPESVAVMVPVARAMHVIVAGDIVKVTTVRNQRRSVVIQVASVVPRAMSMTSVNLIATESRMLTVTLMPTVTGMSGIVTKISVAHRHRKSG